ncbi:periplasmic glycine betaine choline-binding (lipo)protein of an ABC-type transport system [Furfurilactobacillus siliginis]|uniref:Periplasmic glycine betaine choline-binding (Lipo)protein of an ABC-type transport system n=1 Tax=Furfurilactobacillus siliginis TaxID=348151 RepID=A0A0R2LDM0_9LACO|nr:periplasmic glycine betaine choline-binding (lipo)protein of an ABC-type transport system [Furfurilactobacillus siliginis]
MLLASAGLMLALGGCGFPGLNNSRTGTVRIAAQSTTESQIMAEMLKDLIQHETPYKSTIIANLGSGNVTFNAQKRGDADVTATRYTGTDLESIMGKKIDRSRTPAQTDAYVTRYFKQHYHMTYFPSYGFADTYAWMVTQDFAKENHVTTVSDLKPVAKRMKVGIDPIWENRHGDGYTDFKRVYGYAFNDVYPMQIGLVYDALENVRMDAVLGYSTDGRIASYHLKVLTDDRNLFPPYNCSAAANDAALKRFPALRPTIARLNGKLDAHTMQQLNYQVDNDLEEPATVAQRYLRAHHYFEEGK